MPVYAMPQWKSDAFRARIASLPGSNRRTVDSCGNLWRQQELKDGPWNNDFLGNNKDLLLKPGNVRISARVFPFHPKVFRDSSGWGRNDNNYSWKQITGRKPGKTFWFAHCFIYYKAFVIRPLFAPVRVSISEGNGTVGMEAIFLYTIHICGNLQFIRVERTLYHEYNNPLAEYTFAG